MLRGEDRGIPWDELAKHPVSAGQLLSWEPVAPLLSEEQKEEKWQAWEGTCTPGFFPVQRPFLEWPCLLLFSYRPRMEIMHAEVPASWKGI